MSSTTANGTTLFLATGSGANLNIAEIDSALAAGNNVIVNNGVGGAQNGSIFTSGITSFQFANAPGTTLTIQSGFGSANSDIALSGLKLTKQGTLIVDANQNVNLSGELSAGTMTITAGTGAISMPTGGELAATTLNMTAGGEIGTAANPINTSVNSLAANSSGGDGSQFVTEANSLSGLNLNAGGGNVTLLLIQGPVADNDAALDISAATATVILGDSVSREFGAGDNPIQTSVDALTVITEAGGGQFITESNGLAALELDALNDSGIATGTVVLTVTAGSVSDTDSKRDLLAGSTTVTLNDSTVQNFGDAVNAIGTRIADGLTVNTAAGGGSQFMTEINLLAALNLNAGTGNVTLTLEQGALFDTDFDTDITADGAIVLMDDPTARNFGALTNAIGTSVNSLTVFTNGGGSQFIRETTGLSALDLNATSAGNVTLTLDAGGVIDTDAGNDITAAAATITLSDSTVQQFGIGDSAGTAIQTNVDSLSVDTSAGNGSQFILETNGFTALNLNANNGGVRLTVLAGAVADNDSAVDIFANTTVVTVVSSTPANFGSATDPIGTSVSTLLVVSAIGDGDLFIAESNGLTSVVLNADAGNVRLTVSAGAVIDSDLDVDITAATADISLLDPNAKRDFGSSAAPIETNVNTLSVNTAVSAGDQFISEVNSTLFSSMAGTGSVTLVSGTFDLLPGNAISDLSTLTVNNLAVVNLPGSNSETIGGLAGSGTVAFKADGALQFLVVGGNNQNTTFSGVVAGNDVASGITFDHFAKSGTGTLTLSGSHSFTGAYTVAAGAMLVTGSITANSGIIQVNPSATLGGTGTLNRTTKVQGRLAPGTSPGLLSSGQLQLDPGSTFDVEITNANASGFDRVSVTGAVFIITAGAGVELNLIPVGNVNLQVGQQLSIITNDGTEAVQGTFKGLPEGANLGSNFLGSGLTATISYLGFTGTQNDVVLTMSPGSLFPWHNEDKAFDVNGGLDNAPDTHVVAGDALAVINYLNAFGAGEVPGNAVLGLPFGFLDTDGDNFVSAGDALEVINFINAGLGGEGEGEVSAEFGLRNVEWQAGIDAAIENEELIALLAVDVAKAAERRREDRKEREELTEFLAGRGRVFGFTSGWIGTRESVGSPPHVESFFGRSPLAQAPACEISPAAPPLLHFDNGEADWLTGSSRRDWFFGDLDVGVLDEITDLGNDEDNDGV